MSDDRPEIELNEGTRDDVRARCNRAERMLERVLAGFQVAAVEPERLISIVNNLHDGVVHFLGGEEVEGLGESDGPTAETYERVAAWATMRATVMRDMENYGKRLPSATVFATWWTGYQEMLRYDGAGERWVGLGGQCVYDRELLEAMIDDDALRVREVPAWLLVPLELPNNARGLEP